MNKETTKARYYSAKLVCSKGVHRRLFFPSYESMTNVIELIVRHQGFNDRHAQYVTQRKIENGLICKRRIVKHRQTRTKLEIR